MKLKITVHGVAYEVDVEVLDPGEGFAAAGPLPPPPHRRPTPANGAPPPPPSATPSPGVHDGSQSEVSSPIGGTVIEVSCAPGDRVEQGQTLVVIEAMKMNTAIAAPAGAEIKTINVAAGDTVREGQILVELA